MSATDRRFRILQALFKRRKESMEAFATEFCVSYMTIFRDIQFLSCYFPIVTKRGITGGVSFMDGYVWGLRHLTIPQTRLLERLSAQLFGEDLQLMQEILHTFSEPISMNLSGDDL